MQTVKHGCGSLMFLGCFSWRHLGRLVNIAGPLKKEEYLGILKPSLPEFVDISAYPDDEVLFQQDEDPNWLANQHFKVLKWPAQSPNLKPMERL